MSTTDEKYIELVKDIILNGELENPEEVRPKYADGTPAITKKVLNKQIKFDTQSEVPVLTIKRVPQKDPIIELDWIWKNMSNDVNFLNELGCTVWDEWKRKDGTIGKAYGYQLRIKKRKVKIDLLLLDMYFNNELSVRCTEEEYDIRSEYYDGLRSGNEEYVELNQVDYLLYTLKKSPSSRRIITTLWCVEDLDDMSLEPCVYETQWVKHNGKLNLTVGIRSNDIGLGNPYNMYQYFVLLKRVAQVTGLESAELCFNITIPHLYERHIKPLLERIDNSEPLEQPEFWINKDITSFYDFTPDDTKLINYKHCGKLDLEIAI